jgi:hypothetical protein
MIADLRYALRVLRRAPGFTLAVVLTVALGIGANSAIFSVVYGVLLRPLPYAAPSELVMIYGRYPEFGRTSPRSPIFKTCARARAPLRRSRRGTAQRSFSPGRGNPSA